MNKIGEISTQRRYIVLRWIIVSTIPLGAAFTIGSFESMQMEYLGAALVGTLTLAFIMVRIQNVGLKTLPDWFLLFQLLIGYYYKFYYLRFFGNTSAIERDYYVEAKQMAIADDYTALSSYEYLTAVLIAFALIIHYKPTLSVKNIRSVMNNLVLGYGSGPILSLTLGAILSIITAYTAIRFSMLNMAELGERTDFRLAGWLYHIRLCFIPACVLFAATSALRTQRTTLTILSFVTLIVHGLSDILVRTTKAGLLIAGLEIAFLAYFTLQKIPKFVIVTCTCLLILTISLFPVVAAYRQGMWQGDVRSVESFQQALNESRLNTNQEYMTSTISPFISRFIGIDNLAMIMRAYPLESRESAYNILKNYGTVGSFVTHNILGTPEGVATAEAPSLLGVFYVYAGWYGIVLFLGYVTGFMYLWHKLSDQENGYTPVLLTFALIMWIQMNSEGTLDLNIWIPISAYYLSTIFVSKAFGTTGKRNIVHSG